MKINKNWYKIYIYINNSYIFYMSLSHPFRVIISKGRRHEKTIKKFISSPKNESPKATPRTHSPLRHTIIRFYKVDPPHDPIIFNFTKLTNKNFL